MTRIPGTLLLICLATGGAASADETRFLSGSLGATSDFVFRGFSLTRGKPAAQASFEVEIPGEIYFGGFVAGANPNPGPSPAMEFDAWAGKYWRVTDDVSFDLRLSQYTYPDDPRRANYNRSEISGTWGLRNRVFVAAIYSPNTKAVGSSPGYGGEGAWAVEISGRHALNDRFTLLAGAGYYGLDRVYRDDFLYWNATLSMNLAPFELQLAWLGIDHDAAEHFREDSIGNRVAVTALWRFSSVR